MLFINITQVVLLHPKNMNKHVFRSKLYLEIFIFLYSKMGPWDPRSRLV